jgi:hypothetical protein
MRQALPRTDPVVAAAVTAAAGTEFLGGRGTGADRGVVVGRWVVALEVWAGKGFAV